MLNTLEELIKLIRDRKKSSNEDSYTKKLLDDKKLSVTKVKEEIGELIESVENKSNKIHEAADVLYHLLFILKQTTYNIEDVMDELKNRKNVRNNVHVNLILFADTFKSIKKLGLAGMEVVTCSYIIFMIKINLRKIMLNYES